MRKLLHVFFCIVITEVHARFLSDNLDLYFPLLTKSFGLVSHIKNSPKCPPRWGLKRARTTPTLVECEPCVVGHTYSLKYSNKRLCWPCSKCGIGLYEARKCSASRDTVCDDCTRFIYKPQLKNIKDFHTKCGYIFLRKTSFRSEKIMHGRTPI